MIVIRFSSWIKNQSLIIKFRTLGIYESHVISLIEGVEKYLAPNSLAILGGWRDGAWLTVTVSVNGYEREYVEKLLRDVAWQRNIHLIKVIMTEVEVG